MIDMDFLEPILRQTSEALDRQALNPGWSWEGAIQSEHKTVLCRGYLAPGGQCFRFTVDGRGPYQALTDYGFSQGYNLGAKCPDWARFPKGDRTAFKMVSRF